MRLVLFDIDGTLISAPSCERRFYRHLFRSGEQGPRQLALYLRGAMSAFPRELGSIMRTNKAYLAGLHVQHVKGLAADWVAASIERAFFLPALRRLQQHHAAGDRVILLSGTPDFIAEAIAAHLGVSASVGTEIPVCNGQFAHTKPETHPFGATKQQIGAALAAAEQVDAADVVAYGNAFADLALLQWAGEAVAVRPDRRLAAAARRYGWEILDR